MLEEFHPIADGGRWPAARVIVGVVKMGAAFSVGDIMASSNDAIAKEYTAISMVDDREQTLWDELGYVGGLFKKLALTSSCLCESWAGPAEGQPISSARWRRYLDRARFPGT